METSPVPAAPTAPRSADDRLYLAVDGQPQGPFDLSQVKIRFEGGMIPPGTLICPAGGSAWEPVADFLAGSSEAPAAPAPAAFPVIFQPNTNRTITAPRKKDTLGWEILLLSVAFVLCFTNWVKCSVCSQSGYEAMLGTGEINPYASDASKAKTLAANAIGTSKSFVPSSPLCIAAAACLILALFTSLTSRSRRVTGFAALTAAALLILQAKLSFPFETRIAGGLDKYRSPYNSPSSGIPDNPDNAQFIEARKAMSSLEEIPLLRDLELHYTLFFFGTIAALAGAGVIAFMGSGKPPETLHL